MKRNTKNIVVGVITSLFLSTLIGGAVVGYLNGPDSREMLRSGAIVGAIGGFVFATVVVLMRYLVIERIPSGSGGIDQYLAEAGLIFTLSVLTAIFGAGFGNALAYRSR